MAGHSKWANIRHRKERVDNKRGKIFSRLVREIFIAAKLGGGDPSANPRLRLALSKSKIANLPKDNIEKAIKRGIGQLAGVSYEEKRYEGYGPAGVAVIVDCLTDNTNRTTSSVRHAFTRYGGNLGISGSVEFMFERVGQFLYAPGQNTDKLIDLVIEAGARDFIIEQDNSLEVLTEPKDFHDILHILEHASPPDVAELIMRPKSLQEINVTQTEKMRKTLDALDDCDDTQHIYCNAQFPD